MLRRRALSCAAALLLLGALPGTADASTSTGVTVDTLAPGYDLDLWTQQVDLAKKAGFKTIRTEVDWRYWEQQPGVTDVRFQATVDAATKIVRDRGLKMVVVVQGTPCWASTAPDSVKKGCDTDEERERAGSYPPEDPEKFADFVATVAGRYQADWRAVEIWNEPDGSGEYYFGGPDKPKRYAAMMKALYPKVKAAAPAVQVYGGSLVGSNGAFLQALYDEGFKGTYDALSVHFYDLVLASLRAIHDVQIKNGDDRPLVLGEFGWSSCYPARRLSEGGQACVTEAQQGRYITDVLASLRRTSWVSSTIVYHLRDSTTLRFGLTTIGFRAKQAFGLVSAALKRPTSSPRRVTLLLRRSGGRVVASGSGPAADVYEIAVSQAGQLRYKAEFRLDRNARFALKLPPQLGTRGLVVRVRHYWTNRSATKRI